MKIVTKKQQEEIDAMIIKKLRFVARATLENFTLTQTFNTEDRVKNKETIERAMAHAEQVFWADDVI